MKKLLFCLISLFIIMCLIPSQSQAASFDLSREISNDSSRNYVEAMLRYHLTENRAVKKTLQDGYAAVFFFEGCSDNMEDPQLCDLSYYRVSAVCIALRLDDDGNPCVVYFNEDCSTLPDRPLEYGKWYIEEVGDVGPATVCDGTYELYSVYHAGAYEALQIRTTRNDESLPAVYMTPEGYVTSRATEINVHTRTVNHTIEGAMWSAGCLLVGDGFFEDFTQLVEAAYYGSYRVFHKGLKVGTVTIDRKNIETQMQTLYQNPEAIETLLAASAKICPDTYLQKCTQVASLDEEVLYRMVTDTQMRTLPCSGDTDVRSISVLGLHKGDRVGITGTFMNSEGERWHRVELLNGTCYLNAADAEEVPQSWWAIIGEFLNLKR